MTTSAIRVRGLVHTYPGKPPVEAVRGLDLDVGVGECFGLLGPNGAGKTTTLEIVEGLLTPTAGEVEVLGMNWAANERSLRHKIGISLQETKLSDKLTVRETVTLFRSFYSTGIAPDEAVARVSLEEKAHAYVDKLSGGQRQRLAVATAIVGDPELLFLDEPTTGLDPQSRRQLWDVIRAVKGRGRTVVITTHYMDEAERLCDRVAVVDHGKVIALGTPAELIARVGGEHVVDLDLDPTTPVRPEEGDLKQLPTVTSVRAEGDKLTLTAAEPHRALPAALDLVRAKGIKIAGLTTRTATLEDVFVTLTGRHLRDAG
ncbi:MAG: ABC transporter ATP-binding protein [Gemmataceae bacterium]|nr:ABC transporter ATP-binding protein [Gemmataceae bacterium]